MTKRISLEQKISELLLKEELSIVSFTFYGGKFSADYKNDIYTYHAKSKSISRAMSELVKFIKESE